MDTYFVTSPVPTPIAARSPVSPTRENLSSGDLFDLLVAEQNGTTQLSTNTSNSSNDLLSLQSLESSTLSNLDQSLLDSLSDGNTRLSEFLQNPTLAKYMLQYIKSQI